MTNKELDSFYEELGARIRAARVSAKKNQEELAIEIGLTRPSIVNMEKGRQRPSIHNLLEIANVLQVQYTQLVPDKILNKHLNTPIKSFDIDTHLNEVGDASERVKQAFLNVFARLNDK